MGDMHRAVVVLFLASGCAFSLSGPDPDRPQGQAPQCDTGKGLVVLDGLVAATAGVIAVAVAGESEPGIALLSLSIGALYAGGAIRGNSNVNNCRAAMEGYESYLASRSVVPPRGIADDGEDGDDGDDGEPREPRRPPRASATVPSSRPATTVPAPMPAASATTTPPAPPMSSAVAPAAEGAATPPPTARPPAPPLPAPADDDWSAFWREVE